MASQQTLSSSTSSDQAEPCPFQFIPIGYLKTCFKTKNGTPRQPSICSYARASLRISKSLFVRPDHSIEGLHEFSHVWLLFVFHQNDNKHFTKAKIKPPRLNGQKVGVFSCRSPYRPNPIGLTLAKLESIEGDTLHLTGIDIIDGTPILDIKPYIPDYDFVNQVQTSKESVLTETADVDEELSAYDQITSTMAREESGCIKEGHHLRNRVEQGRITVEEKSYKSDLDVACSKCSVEHNEGDILSQDTNVLSPADQVESCHNVQVGKWVLAPPVQQLKVRFTPSALKEILSFNKVGRSEKAENKYCLELLKDHMELKAAISSILSADPRSTYRRNSCRDKLYFFPLDSVHITCWFGDDFVEVLRVQPLCDADIPSGRQ